MATDGHWSFQACSFSPSAWAVCRRSPFPPFGTLLLLLVLGVLSCQEVARPLVQQGGHQRSQTKRVGVSEPAQNVSYPLAMEQEAPPRSSLGQARFSSRRAGERPSAANGSARRRVLAQLSAA